MRVLILGGGGMLGHQVWRVIRDRFEVRVAVRERPALPLFDDDRVIVGFESADAESLIADVKPQAVVNCIGIVKQLAAAHDPVASITINSLFPHLVARACDAIGARLVQISTDCVFSGTRGGYRESDVPDPLDLYGRSKLLGEVDAPHLTIRTSIVGPEWKSSHGLLAWLLGQRGGQVKGFTRALFSGLSTIALSRILAEVVEQHRDLAGLWHVASEPISKYDLLMLLNEAFDANITIEADDSVVIDRTLDGSRFAEATGIAVPSWREMAQELAQ